MGWVLETKDSSWSGSGLQREQGNRELGESCQLGEMRKGRAGACGTSDSGGPGGR